ncbi:hypothetical protein SUGI_0737330 [Cryptomeria japonica]|nr:hypothetical protein SUGI_0737330 [Cryptomeria japonica]
MIRNTDRTVQLLLDVFRREKTTTSVCLPRSQCFHRLLSGILIITLAAAVRLVKKEKVIYVSLQEEKSML